MKRLLGRAAPRHAAATPLLVDDGNRAAAAAIGRAGSGGRGAPSPLVLVGPPDSGKTRLLQELAFLVARRGGTVCSGTMREWIRRVRAALRDRTLSALGDDLDRADLLVIDEMHRLGTGSVTRDFLVSRIAERVAQGRLVAVASRHHPARVRRLTPRGVSLLLGGLVLDVARPGPEVRRRYLAEVGGRRLSPEAVERLCATSSGGLRELAENARTAGSARPAPPPVAVARVAVAVARELGVDAQEILGRRRTAGIVRARVGFVLAAHRLGARTEDLAASLGGRGAPAVRRLEEAASAAARDDAALAAAVDRVVERVRARNA